MAKPMNNTGNPVDSTDPADLEDNARILDRMLNSSEVSVPDRLNNPIKTWFAIQNGFDKIVSSLDTANFTFSSEPAGIAATTNGQYFRVPQGTESSASFNYYRNNAGVALLVAVAGSDKIFRIRIPATTDLNTVPPGGYFVIEADINTIVDNNQQASLHYPLDMVKGGSLSLDVKGNGLSTNWAAYQTMTFHTQGVIQTRQISSGVVSAWVNVNKLILDAAEAAAKSYTDLKFNHRVPVTQVLSTLITGGHYVIASDIAAIIAAGTQAALEYPLDMVAGGSATIAVLGNDSTTNLASYQQMTFPTQGVIYLRQISSGVKTPWINVNQQIYDKALTAAKQYALDNFYPKEFDDTNHFPFSNLLTTPNFHNGTSYWSIATDGQGVRRLTLTSPTAGLSTYVGWQYPIADTPLTFNMRGTGYQLISGGGFIVRIRFLATNTQASTGADVLGTVDIDPIINGSQYTFSRDKIPVPAGTNFIRAMVIIPTAKAPCQLSFAAGNFMTFTDSAPKSLNDVILEEINAEAPPMIKSEVTSQLSVLSSGLSDYVQKGRVILADDGIISDRLADHSCISWWGSSTIAGMNTQLTAMAARLGIANVYNGGRAGEVYQYHAARMGVTPAILSVPLGVIPASGTVAVQPHNFISAQANSLQPFSGVLNGVTGTLSYSAGSSTGYIFTRTVPGEAVPVAAADTFPFIPDYDRKFVSGYGVLNYGKNNLATEANTAQETFDATVAAFNFYRPFFKRIVVVNHYANTEATPASIALVKVYNDLAGKGFGDLIVDNYGYLMGNQVWTDTGLSPTASDVIAQGKGCLAPSLTNDGIHMKSNVTQLLTDKYIEPLFRGFWFS